MEIYLIRHTSPLVEKGVCYGQADLALNLDKFECEYDGICAKIPFETLAFYSSPLQRCLTLAQALSPTVTTDKRLMELNFGDWELENWTDIPAGGLQVWMDDFVHEQVPGGENYTALYQRTVEFMEDLLQRKQKNVAIVTHAGNIRSIISWALDLPLVNSFRIKLDYGAVVHIEIHENKQLNQLKSLV
jgi:alpha-ribazole phosphatase